MTQRYKPYKDTRTLGKKPRADLATTRWPHGYMALPPPPPLPSPSLPMNEELAEEGPTLREVSIGIIRKLYPGITPRDDFDIATLAHGTYRGPLSNEAAYEWLDALLRSQAGKWPSDCKTSEQGRAFCLSRAKIALDRPAQVTGVRSIFLLDNNSLTCN